MRSGDLKRFHELINDPDVAASTLSIPYPMKLGTAKIWVDYYVDPSQHGKGQHWAICPKTDSHLIGMINVFHFDRDNTRAEIGFWLGKDFWNCGYGSEATAAVVQYAFDQFKLDRIVADYQVSNKGSARILEKAGFVPLRMVRVFNPIQNRWEKVIQVVWEAANRIPAL